MRRAGLIAVAAVVLLGAAYLAGYLPERSRRIAAAEQAASLQAAFAGAESRVRVAALLGQAITLKEVAMRQNYGQALELSPRFFDAVRAEALQSADASLRSGLEEISARRDALTAALAKTEPAVVDTLHQIEVRLRVALGYALPPEAVATPSR
jgi:hypothetical protein